MLARETPTGPRIPVLGLADVLADHRLLDCDGDAAAALRFPTSPPAVGADSHEGGSASL